MAELDDSAFEELALRLSESPGYFDTDNLVSNETSYQHALSRVEKGSGAGRAYIGVGPGQNFTYLAHIKPAAAVIIDIRRDNQLFHLYWKQLFQLARDRADFLSRLLGKPLAADFRSDPESDAEDLIERFSRIPSQESAYASQFEEIWKGLRQRFPRLVLEEDKPTLERISRPFYEFGFGLRFRSHGRRPRAFYPTFGQLILATDLDARRGHYLQSEDDFQDLKRMQEENRIIPIVGDFAGSHALRSAGRYLERQGLPISAFYMSNVEFYLFQSGAYRSFVDNLRSLPIDQGSLFIRSHFGNFGPHPDVQPGHFVACLLQKAERFLSLDSLNPYHDYHDVVTRDYLPLRAQAESPR